MKKTTVRRLMDVPGARVSLSEGVLRVGGKPVSVPWFDGTLEVGVLCALPRVGVPLKIDADDPLQFARFVGPALFDAMETHETLRKFLGLGAAEPGAYTTVIERGSEVLVREIVGVLRKMKKGSDWQARLTAGIASGIQDSLVNGIPVAGGSTDWARAVIDAVEAAEAVKAA